MNKVNRIPAHVSTLLKNYLFKIAIKAGIKSCLLLFFIVQFSTHSAAQKDSLVKTDSLGKSYNRARLGFVVGGGASLYLGAFIGSNEFWYKDSEQIGFHFFNDNDAWQQQDKFGHALESYHIGRVGYEMIKWTGVSEKKAVWYGGICGTVYLLNIELLDGFSSGWGFSIGDFGADLFGSAAFISQQLAWKEQRFLMKISYHDTEYSSYRPRLLGTTFAQRFMKDYNGQTYWLSVSPGAFMKNSKFPEWLCFSVGMGAEGMTGGSNNPSVAEDGVPIPYFDRYRKFYASVDIDLSKVPTRCKLLHSVLSTINLLKVPMPTLEYSNNKGFRGHWLYF